MHDSPAEHRERNIRKAMTECKHFIGVQHELCSAGANLRTLVGGPDLGWCTRIPCFSTNAEAPPCSLRALHTRGEAEQAEAEHEATMEKFRVAHRAAKEHAKGITVTPVVSRGEVILASDSLYNILPWMSAARLARELSVASRRARALAQTIPPPPKQPKGEPKP